MAAKFKKGVDLQGQRGINAADPSAGTDLVTKQYADALTRNLSWKEEVIAGSTGNVTLAAPGTTLDGVTLTAGDRVLLKDQTAAAENGIYIWTGAAAALTRAPDADTGPRLSGSTTTVQRGTVNADRVYRVLTDDPITVGTTAIAFGQVGGGSAPYTAGNGLALSGQEFRVNNGAGILADGTSTRIDPTIVARVFNQACVATTNPQSFTHGLGKKPVVQVVLASTGEVQYPDLTITTTQVTVDWGTAPTAGEYEVIAVG